MRKREGHGARTTFCGLVRRPQIRLNCPNAHAPGSAKHTGQRNVQEYLAMELKEKQDHLNDNREAMILKKLESITLLINITKQFLQVH